MLFYERYKSDPEEQKPLVATTTESSEEIEPIKFRINLSQDLAEVRQILGNPYISTK